MKQTDRRQHRLDALERANELMDELVFKSSLLNHVSEVAQQEVECEAICHRILALVRRVLQSSAGGILYRCGTDEHVVLQDGSDAAFELEVRRAWLNRRIPAVPAAEMLFLPIRKDGTDLGMLGVRLPVPWTADPRQSEILGLIARDLGPILERGLATARLRQEYEERLEFVRDLAHDLRNPLTGVLSTLLSLSNPELKFDPAAIRRLLAGAVRSAQELDAMLDDLLDVHRADAGALGAHLTAFEASDAIARVATALEPAAAAKGLALSSSFQPEMPKILADARLLNRTLTNLVANAIKFTPSGRVEIRSWHDDRQIHLSVDDTGPGVSGEARKHLFELYYRAPDACGLVPGTGMGLAFCKRAVEAMGGSLGLEESDLGGSRFHVRLPAA